MPCPTDPKCNDPLRLLMSWISQINPKRPNAPDSSFTIPPYHFDTPQAYVCMTRPEEKSKSPKKMPCPTDPKCNDPLRLCSPHTPQINPKRPNAPDSSFTIPP